MDGTNLSKGSFPYEGVDLVPVEELLPVLDDVVVVVVVEAVVVELALLLVRAVVPLRLLCSPLLLRIVHLQTNNTNIH